MKRVAASVLVLGFAVGVALLGARQAAASTFLGSVEGSINDPQDLLLFDAIDDVQGIVLLGSSEENGSVSFPGGDPTAGEGAISGSIVFTGEGTPLFFTVKAGRDTGLYSWMTMGENVWNTGDLDEKPKGFSVARVWGGPDGGNGNGGPAVPEPVSLLLFPLGAAVVGFAVRSRRRQVVL